MPRPRIDHQTPVPRIDRIGPHDDCPRHPKTRARNVLWPPRVYCAACWFRWLVHCGPVGVMLDALEEALGGLPAGGVRDRVQSKYDAVMAGAAWPAAELAAAARRKRDAARQRQLEGELAKYVSTRAEDDDEGDEENEKT